MKNNLKLIPVFAMAALFGTVALSAQSCAAVNHVSNAAVASGTASKELVGATAESAKGAVKLASGVAAVPVWMSGAVVQSGGKVLAAVGDASAQGGEAAAEGAAKMWDFATSDDTARPPLDREAAVPPVKATESASVTPAKTTLPADPSPAEALKATR
ncbi:hypothetical protein K0B96_16185 [Horticoccus luteus]|uniref:Lipoprotein n=1 Tax=Horticoccus luteus TaxID=2862869 RepID=A0A8F9TVH5_9BACT|nr:hypothetical protein [Horticoccus luteus]QYM78822.1 hypothetical protein K0B96_16185 [Horticoccus luteus]